MPNWATYWSLNVYKLRVGHGLGAPDDCPYTLKDGRVGDRVPSGLGVPGDCPYNLEDGRAWGGKGCSVPNGHGILDGWVGGQGA